MNANPPPMAEWTPPVPGRPTSNGWIAVVLALVGLIAVSALVVGIIALTRPADSADKAPTAATTPRPTFTADQIATAKKELCVQYQIAARAVKQDTNATDVAIARVSVTNAAGMLEVAASNPALGNSERDAARNLAAAYRNADAISSVFDKTSPVFQQAVDDVNRLDGAMAAICP